jgi:DUF4097 and DUF4098 domain-containing protein YvlB
MLGMTPGIPAPLRVRIGAFSGVVTLAAESRSDVVVDQGGVAATGEDGSVEIGPRRRSDAIAVRCPVGADVIVGTHSGNVELSGTFGAVAVTSESGSIRVVKASEADLRTVSGAVELDECDGRCRISTTSGRIAVGATGELEASTKSGSISVVGSAGTVQVHSVSGSVTLGSSGRAALKATTVSGSITIRLPAGTRPEVRSSGGGTLRNTFDPGDDVLVEVANVSGDVQLVPA